MYSSAQDPSAMTAESGFSNGLAQPCRVFSMVKSYEGEVFSEAACRRQED